MSHTFNTSTHRIGFACIWAEINKKGQISSTEGLNTGGTTWAWAKRNSRDVAEKRIMEIVERNINNTHNLLKRVATLDPQLRMVRMSSDIIPFYTLDDFVDFWQDADNQRTLAKWFEPLGVTARQNDIRLSFHPDQFVVLASDRPEVVEKSIQEFEYHTDMARWMGYGCTFQDMKINVHISGRRGTQGIRDTYGRLSPEARNCLTLENEEISYGLDDCLSLSDLVPVVLDIHHHWVREGVYIQNTDDNVKRVIDSWRGIRPTMHYSVSREDILLDHCPNTLPNHAHLIANGHNKQKLRAHSDYYWNVATNRWALSFNSQFDIMCESKAKNLASFKLYEELKNVEQNQELIQTARAA